MKILNNLAHASGRRIMRLKSSKPYRKLIFASMAIVIGFIVGMKTMNPEVFAQTNEKNISLGTPSFSEPQVKIKEVKVGEKSRKFDENFKEDSDWLGNTLFQVENVSSKPIIYLRVNIWFPETEASGPVMVYPITFGQRPGSKLQKGDPLLFMPKETLDVSLAAKYDEISRFLIERRSIESIQKIRLEVSFIVFDDSTAWSVGTFMTRDPDNSDRYIPVQASLPERKP